MNQYCFIVAGDEPRQNYLSELLRKEDYLVRFELPSSTGPGQRSRSTTGPGQRSRSTTGPGQRSRSSTGPGEVVLLPVPHTKQYLEDMIDHLSKGQIVFGCNFPPDLLAECDQRGIRCIDYMKVEGVAARNAVATAEGAVVEALSDAVVTIQGSKCLVTGYGCCGRVLAEKLLSMKAQVTVMERKNEKRAIAKASGCEAVSFEVPPEEMEAYDYIFNTVPALVLTEKNLSCVKKDVRIIDIASKPGGVDFHYCQKKGIHAKLCLGLPGKYAPKSSAGILLEVIEKTIFGEK